MDFDKTSSAGFLANQMARLFAAGLARRIRPLGLAPAQFMVLVELWTEEGLSQAELVARLDVEQATMANTLARMERDGLILRAPSPTDGRVRLAYLTDKARALRGPATAAAQAENAEALSALSEAERAQFIALMNRVVRTLRKRRQAPPPADAPGPDAE